MTEPVEHLFSQAKALAHRGQLEQAMEQLKALLAIDAYHTDGWNLLGRLCQHTLDFNMAHYCYQNAVACDATAAEAHVNLASLFNDAGATTDARKHYDQGFALRPDNLPAALGHHLIQPIIPSSTAAITEARKNYERGLQYLISHQADFRGQPNLSEELLWAYGFYLAYQGLNDRAIQIAWNQFFEPLVKTVVPDLFKPLNNPSRPQRKRKIRVGYASCYLHRHTVSHYFKGWIEQANHDDFEVYAYQLDGRADEVSESIAAHCDQFRRLTGSLTRMGNAIRQDQLDILVYLEVGMSKKARWLSATRLAPIQCSAWGHPVTTGLSTIDYYLSGGDTEPDNGDDYYSESLVRLNGLGIYCSPRLAPDDGDRKALGLPEGRNLYLCPQSLFKIHPDADRLFARIAAQDVNALILFFEGKTIPLGTRTKQRLEPIFQQEGADFERQTKFLPQMNHPNYLRLNRLADVMLDVPHWSGGMTSLDALANGLPIITLEGEQSRGRQTSAMYRMMGITDLIAADDAAYVTTAIKLAQDAELKAHYSKQIMGRMEETLFHNPDAVPSLEEFYRQAHGETRENRP